MCVRDSIQYTVYVFYYEFFHRMLELMPLEDGFLLEPESKLIVTTLYACSGHIITYSDIQKRCREKIHQLYLRLGASSSFQVTRTSNKNGQNDYPGVYVT